MAERVRGRTGGTGAGSRRAADGGARAPRRPTVSLPALTAYADGELETEGDYDGLDLADLDLSGQVARGARFLDCGIRRCALGGTVLAGARFVDSAIAEVRGVGTDLSSASLRDVELTDARLGGTQAHGGSWERVLVRGGKIDYLNLRRARLRDVTFEGCVLIEADFGDASLERVSFVGCVLRRADFSAARMKDVDLRGVTELDIARGLDALSGAVISPAQLLDLAPAFASQLGVRVEAGPGGEPTG
ncbi:pentapeptide repeat-containing protein [Streptomyces sp. NPDC057702]|uniref:pentapeptide repeat-containing protein n=1 Tax=unclassified Streptomyces TaxID=2593676 RepID=UPI0036AD3A5F